MNTSKLWILWTVLGLLALSGCSGIRVSQDFSPKAPLSGISTFDWDTRVRDVKDRTREDNPLVLDRIRAALETTLAEKGWTRQAHSPQCRVAYDYRVETKLSSTQTGPRFGIAMSTGGGGALAFGSGTDIEQYDQGQVLVDLLDPGTGRLIWRGKATFRVANHQKPAKMTQKINTAVEKIMAQFPPENK